MIVDTHVHVYPPEIRENWQKYVEKERHFAEEASESACSWTDARDVLDAMDESGVDECWVSGFASSDLSLCKLCNDFVLDICRNSSGRLKAMAVVPPLCRGMEDEVLRCANAGAIGVGELSPGGQDFALDDSRETWRLASVCHENGLFLTINCHNPLAGCNCRISASAREAYALALSHPELKIVFARWGDGLFFYEMMPDVRIALRNVWYDTAGIPAASARCFYAAARAAGVCGKLLYGSDFPVLWGEDSRRALDESTLVDEERIAVLSGNAQALLSA